MRGHVSHRVLLAWDLTIQVYRFFQGVVVKVHIVIIYLFPMLEATRCFDFFRAIKALTIFIGVVNDAHDPLKGALEGIVGPGSVHDA